MTTYLLMIWMTVAGAQSFAEHQFTNKAACESFAHWLIRDQHLTGAKAVCVEDHGYAI